MTINTHIDNAIATISINRAERHNALNAENWALLSDHIKDAQANQVVNIIILTGSGEGHFCAGADIGEMNKGRSDEAWLVQNQAAIRGCQSGLAEGPKPVIAAIDGDAIGGGCGLAAACDIRLVSSRSRFGITPAKLGIVYSLYDTKLLVAILGPAKAKELLFTANIIAADEALRFGMVNHICADPLAEARKMAERMSSLSQHSITATKSIVGKILGGQADDDDALKADFRNAFLREEFGQRVDAFVGRKK